jgi:hypothetical protein
MRRPLTFVVAALFAFALLTTNSLAGASRVSAGTIAPTVTCSNGVDTTPGLGLICEVTIVNTITSSGGTATVTIRECHGAAGDPEAACTTTTNTLTEPVTAVTQCNGSISSGGTLRCSIDVTNNFIGINPAPTAVTVNQCVGSGDGDTTGCDPTPANTTGATITQCNGSANGGTLVELTCTATGTESPALLVTINQCNGSANGGGALVICTASIRNVRVAVAATSAPSSASSGGSNAVATPPSTDTEPTTSSAASGVLPVVFATILSLAFIATMAGVAGRRTRRAARIR